MSASELASYFNEQCFLLSKLSNTATAQETISTSMRNRCNTDQLLKCIDIKFNVAINNVSPLFHLNIDTLASKLMYSGTIFHLYCKIFSCVFKEALMKSQHEFDFINAEKFANGIWEVSGNNHLTDLFWSSTSGDIKQKWKDEYVAMYAILDYTAKEIAISYKLDTKATCQCPVAFFEHRKIKYVNQAWDKYHGRTY